MFFERQVKNFINIDPLQTGGRLTEDARRTILEWGDGYSICDYCTGKLEKISKPPVNRFVDELNEFFDSDGVRLTTGAREGKFTVMYALSKNMPEKKYVIVDANAHYSTLLAAERARLEVLKVENSGYPEYRINEDMYKEIIEEKGEEVLLAVLTYPDGNYGNFPDAVRVSRICRNAGIPLLLNCAYSAGRMPLSMKKLGADFLVASGHKSMASAGPIGILAFSEEFSEYITVKSNYRGDKEVEFLGCTARGVPLLTLMASFDHVKERVKQWGQEVKKARWFSGEMEKLGIVQLGEKPHNHDLMFFESEVLYEISKRAKKGRYFLYRELKKRRIHGIKPGLTKHFKLSTYLVPEEDLETVIKAFEEIVTSYGDGEKR